MRSDYLASNARFPYCKGCSHGVVLRALGEALTQLQLLPEHVVVVTDIGCVGLADAMLATPHTVHTTHGRSTAFAAGMALADEVLGQGALKLIVLIGDGGAMIGLNHLVHAALLNADVTVLVHNNFLFGMTGGQNSAYTPLEFVTSTTPWGNCVPPLDLGQLLLASRASFVARKLATDRDLSAVLARAIAHPGFASVEVLELCTAYATRWNQLTGAQLKNVADAAGYQLGILREELRPRFSASARMPPVPAEGAAREASSDVHWSLERSVGLVLAGTAGEHVQSAASLLVSAAMHAGLHVTQKNDNPVTQGTGFSLSEMILSPEEVLYTGIEKPDALLIVSEDGQRELERNGALRQVSETTLVLADTELALPELPARVLRLPFRRATGPKLAATAAVVTWLNFTRALPLEPIWQAIRMRFRDDANPIIAKLTALLEGASVSETLSSVDSPALL
jgi:2-oxoglutarate/2-oxoacid ferredoxin oxidoreductase subunit beta